LVDVSFEDLIAAHKTEREPGQLPPEGVVLIGVDLDLQRRMAQGIGGAPKIDAPIITAPLERIPEAGVGSNSGALNISALNIGGLNLGALTTAAPNTSGPSDESEPEFQLSSLLVRRSGAKTYIVHPISRLEDVFTSAERELLRWLWASGRVVPPAPKIRLVIGENGEGARRLATQAGLIYNTFKNLTRSLSTKFALDIVKPEKNLPAIYAIYHESAILERQCQAGYNGAVRKNGGGRDLVDAQVQPAQRRPDLTVKDLEAAIGVFSPAH
jgi:hypothetical protein